MLGYIEAEARETREWRRWRKGGREETQRERRTNVGENWTDRKTAR